MGNGMIGAWSRYREREKEKKGDGTRRIENDIGSLRNPVLIMSNA